jgi:hypothetical protein
MSKSRFNSLLQRFLKWWNEPQWRSVSFSSEQEALEFAAKIEQLWPGAEIRITRDTLPEDPEGKCPTIGSNT